jgi:class 3 adenylate cyclase
VKDHTITIENRVILFTDIHNYSIIGRALGHSQYDFLQQVYETLGDVVVEHAGEILKYLGDGLLCIFPAGSENEAVECAIELRKAFAQIAHRWGLTDTELEIGIGSGEVATGVFGHRSLMQREVFGEQVNLAAMIGHHRGIAITESVYGALDARYEIGRLPDMKVKWQDEPVKIWEIKARRPAN